MIKPLGVRVDLESNAAYIRCAEREVAGTLDVWRDGWVAADLDDAGRVIGIEVLALEPDTLEHARNFALAHDLAFPGHLEGARA